MKKTTSRRLKRSQGGFTLIELLVVVLIIGILAAIAIPQYFKVVEKGKASEALTTFDAIRGAQERFLAATGNYCMAAMTPAGCPGWDMNVPAPKYFTMGATAVAGTNSPSWKLTATRNTSPAGYGAYVFTYDVEPSVAPSVSCTGGTGACATDLVPQ
jgi:prepilin-type N-terminal cleavage/methylation domain-containing protein